DQVSNENGLAATRMSPAGVAVLGVSELLQEIVQFVAAAVHVADDVERPVLALPVVPERLTLEDGRIHLVLRLEHVNVPESLAPEPPQRAVQLALLIANDMRPEITVRPRTVAVVTHAFGQIEDDRDRQYVVLASQGHQRLSRLR